MKLILASSSQRRREIMELMGYEYDVMPSKADENIPLCETGEYVRQLAKKKAEWVFAEHRSCCVIGSDTVVELDGSIIGKPRDEADAARILRALSGREHTVYTGTAVFAPGFSETDVDITRVTFAELTDAEIAAYIATGEPMDKAGAYGIQGPAAPFISRIDGCYFTVMGLAAPKLYDMLRRAGVRPRWQK